MHATLLALHRYTGLVVAIFLVSAGITGSLLIWNAQLERAFAPDLFVVPTHVAGMRTLDPFSLRAKALERFPGARITGVGLEVHPDEPAGFILEYPSPTAATDAQVFLDPFTGDLLGSRSGDIREGLKNFMPFISSLHESLVAGDAGAVVLGVVALIWLLQCLTGAYLTLPAYRIRVAAKRQPWLTRWAPSWKLRTYGDFKKINFNFHRAGGLWLWGVLLLFALSSMSFNLRGVYLPAIKASLGYASDFDAIPGGRDANTPPALELQAAYLIAKEGMAKAAKQRGFQVRTESLFMYYPEKRAYDYRVSSSKDVGRQNSDTRLFLDADTGRILGLDLPTGVPGNTFTIWIEAIHEAQVWGTPYRVLETAFGLTLTLLSISGIIVWWNKKRPGDLRRMFKSRPPRTPLPPPSRSP